MTAQLTIDGTPPPEPVIRDGFCGCGCGERVIDRLYLMPSHRQRAYRRRVRVEMERVGLPASPSLRAAGVSRPTGSRNGDAENGGKQPQRRRSGLQVSAPKMADVVAELLASHTYTLTLEECRDIAEQEVRRALSARQREVLEQRERAAA